MTYELPKEKQFIWLLDELRISRNMKLLSCDWTQLADSPLTNDKKAEWATYRQELRDLPATVTDINDDRTITVNWPTEPD